MGSPDRFVLLGAALAIESWVATQFFEITIVEIGSFALSVQKILALVLLPVALLILRTWRIPLTLGWMAILMCAANSAWYVAHGAWSDPRMLGANIGSILVFFGATVLYSGLAVARDGIARLGKAWARWALVTSPVCVAQSLGLLPLFNVPSELLINRATTIGLERAVGFKADPNFQALMLVAGALYLVVFIRSSMSRTAQLGVIAVGILATLSRMGILLFVGVLLMNTIVAASQRGTALRTIGRALIGGTIVAIGTTFAFLKGALPSGLQSYLTARFVDAWKVAVSVSAGQDVAAASGAHLSSAAARTLVALGALRVFVQNPVVGIGAGRSKEILVAASGQFNVAHNTYLEMAMTGGLFGIAFLVVYFVPWVLLWPVRRTAFSADAAWNQMWGYSIALYAVFALVFLLLSLNANSILYVPVVVALATQRARPTPSRSA